MSQNLPKFVEIELTKAKENGHEMGHVFMERLEFISFCKKCHAPMFFTYKPDKVNNDMIRFANGLYSSKCEA